MIRKFLIWSKPVYLSQNKPAIERDDEKTIELLLPIEEFWEIEKIVKESDYSLAAMDATPVLAEQNQRLLKKILPFVVLEKDRTWVYESLKKT